MPPRAPRAPPPRPHLAAASFPYGGQGRSYELRWQPVPGAARYELEEQEQNADQPVIIVLLDSWGKATRIGDANRIKRMLEGAGLASAAGRTRAG